MYLISSVICGVETHLQGIWSMIKANKCLYALFQIINKSNNEYMMEFGTYIKFIKSYGGETPIKNGLVISSHTNMGVQYTNNTAP